MTIHQRGLALSLILAAFAGCEPAAPKTTAVPENPHGGSLYPLPDGQGYVEIVKQPAPTNPKQIRLVAYFLDSSKTPMATTPTDVSLKLPAAGAAPLPFKPSGETDAAKAGGLATEPFPDRSDLAGDVSATISGKSITVPINVR